MLMTSIMMFATHVPTKEKFYAACDSLGIHHPNVVYAQACWESGHFTSKIYRERNNCLGIYDSVRKRYAYFDSWIDCLVAYKNRFQQKHLKDETEENYWKRMEEIKNYTDEEYLLWVVSRGYASDTNYLNNIRKMLKYI